MSVKVPLLPLGVRTGHLVRARVRPGHLAFVGACTCSLVAIVVRAGHLVSVSVRTGSIVAVGVRHRTTRVYRGPDRFSPACRNPTLSSRVSRCLERFPRGCRCPDRTSRVSMCPDGTRRGYISQDLPSCGGRVSGPDTRVCMCPDPRGSRCPEGRIQASVYSCL